MNGIDPTLLPELTLVAAVQEHPAISIPGFREKLESLSRTSYLGDKWEQASRDLQQPPTEKFNYSAICDYIRRAEPSDLRAAFSDEELGAVSYSNVCSFPERIEQLFSTLPLVLVLEKCSLSGWHSGYRRVGWDVAVAAYNGLRRFDLGVPGFTHKIDVTVGCNSRGTSRFTRTFLDAELAIIVEYKGKHVLTIGLDLTLSKEGVAQIFIRQIQLKNEKGNRFLFALRPGYIEAVTRACVDAFQGFEVFLIQGETAATAAADSYRRTLSYTRRDERGEPLTEFDRKEIEAITARIKNVEEEVSPRLRKLYSSPFTALVKRTRTVNGYSRVVSREECPQIHALTEELAA